MKPWPHTQNMHCALTKWGYTTLSMQHFEIINYNKLLNEIFVGHLLHNWLECFILEECNLFGIFSLHNLPLMLVCFQTSCVCEGRRRRVWCQRWIKTPQLSGCLWIQRDPSEHKMLATLFDSLIISWEEK